MCCSTIYVMGLENDRLSSGGTKNQGASTEILSPTDKQYVRKSQFVLLLERATVVRENYHDSIKFD